MRTQSAYADQALRPTARRFPRLLASALLLGLALVPRQAVAAEALLHGEGLLWKIERSDVAPSYLFGTYHTTDEQVHDLPRPVAEALAATDSLALEVVSTDDKEARAGRRMVIRDGHLLNEILGSDFFAQVVATGARYGLPEAGLKRLKPWAVWVIISFPPGEVARMAAGYPTLDEALEAEAMARGIPVYGLESLDEQLDAFDGLSENDQIAMLKIALRDNAAVEEMTERLTRFYLARDLSGIHALMIEQMAGADTDLVEMLVDRFIDARNELMVSRMAARLAEGNAFIAVGALHLPGERGILHLLELQGYTVIRVY